MPLKTILTQPVQTIPKIKRHISIVHIFQGMIYLLILFWKYTVDPIFDIHITENVFVTYVFTVYILLCRHIVQISVLCHMCGVSVACIFMNQKF